MPVVYHAKPHSMAWCLECHRHPENFLRPEDQITNLDWKPEDVNPAEFVAKYGQPKEAKEDWSKKQTADAAGDRPDVEGTLEHSAAD